MVIEQYSYPPSVVARNAGEGYSYFGEQSPTLSVTISSQLEPIIIIYASDAIRISLWASLTSFSAATETDIHHRNDGYSRDKGEGGSLASFWQNNLECRAATF